jgi:Ca2+-binding EF-hand superfamily protein
MRNAQCLFAAAIALAVFSNVATAAPQKDKTHGAAPGVGSSVGAGAANGAAATDPLFVMIDADGDGVISAKELHKAVAAIKEADTDKDGNITWAEIVARSGAIAAAANGQGEITSGMASGGGIGMGGDSQAMGRFMQYDKNHDGKVTVDEVPASMRDWDQNHDGVIDAREMEIAVRRMGDRGNAILGRGLVGGQNGAGKMPGGNPAGPTQGAK